MFHKDVTGWYKELLPSSAKPKHHVYWLAEPYIHYRSKPSWPRKFTSCINKLPIATFRCTWNIAQELSPTPSFWGCIHFWACLYFLSLLHFWGCPHSLTSFSVSRLLSFLKSSSFLIPDPPSQTCHIKLTKPNLQNRTCQTKPTKATWPTKPNMSH